MQEKGASGRSKCSSPVDHSLYDTVVFTPHEILRFNAYNTVGFGTGTSTFDDKRLILLFLFLF